eukprot:3940426-Rhodomonas_salina.3
MLVLGGALLYRPLVLTHAIALGYAAMAWRMLLWDVRVCYYGTELGYGGTGTVVAAAVPARCAATTDT